MSISTRTGFAIGRRFVIFLPNGCFEPHFPAIVPGCIADDFNKCVILSAKASLHIGHITEGGIVVVDYKVFRASLFLRKDNSVNASRQVAPLVKAESVCHVVGVPLHCVAYAFFFKKRDNFIQQIPAHENIVRFIGHPGCLCNLNPCHSPEIIAYQLVHARLNSCHVVFRCNDALIQKPVRGVAVRRYAVRGRVNLCVFYHKCYVSARIIQEIADFQHVNVVVAYRRNQYQLSDIVVVNIHDNTDCVPDFVPGGKVLFIDFKAHSAIPTISVAKSISTCKFASPLVASGFSTLSPTSS